MPLIAGVVSTQVLAVGSASAKFTNPMQPKNQYLFTCESDCWIHVGATGDSAAVDTAGNMFVKAGMVIPLMNPDDSGTTNGFVHAIRQSADGDATLTLIGYKYM